MCGITGFIQYKGGASDELTRRCHAMADTIAHRGPDAGGVWVDPSYPLALGHRRLSIIDLSEAGAQPMVAVEDEVDEAAGHVEFGTQVPILALVGIRQSDGAIGWLRMGMRIYGRKG